jgi:hypothetical protein
LRKHTAYATSVKLYRMPMGQLLFESSLKKLQVPGSHIFNATKDGTLTYALHPVSI